MDFSRYLRFHNESGAVLEFNNDWGVYEFPDGQNQIWFESRVKPVRETVCLNHPAVIDLVRQTAEILGRLELFATYLYGGRSDKTTSGSRYVANVASSTRTLLRDASTAFRILVAHDSADNSVGWPCLGCLSKCDGIVYPDSSARARQPWLHDSGLPEVIFEKVRDQVTGEIIGLATSSSVRGRLLVADDICDGGATFVKVASLLEGCHLDLCVTHGIFSGGALERLSEAGYDRIYTTNSYTQHELEMEKSIDARCSVTDVWHFPNACQTA